MKTRKVWIWFLIVAVLAAAGAAWRLTQSKGRRSMSTSKIVTVEQGPIEAVTEATGEVVPLNRVEIRPPVSGRIEELIINEGDTVKAGQILAWMSSSDRAAILDAARAKGPAELKKWQDTYKPTPIVAPLSGVIILRNVVVGQTVDTSGILFAMSDRLIVRALVDEADIGKVKGDMPARIVLDAYPDQAIEGKVFQILYEGKNVSNVITYGVKILPKEVPPFFRSQMTANVSLILEKKENALSIPAAAVKDSAGGKTVTMAGGDKENPEVRTIETGIRSGDKVEVLSGLAAGDQIVVVQRRYSPQRGPESSPLAIGSRNRSQNQSQSQGRQR